MKKNDVVRVLATTTYHLWICSMKSDHNYHEITHPKIGDLVMEIGSLDRQPKFPDKNNYPRRIGTLREIKEDEYIIDDLAGKRTSWHKHSGKETQFIVIPTNF